MRKFSFPRQLDLRFLGDVAVKRFSLLRSILPFRGLLLCLSVTFVHCAQTAEDIDTISFASTVPCLFQIVLKFGLIGQPHNPFLPQILLQDDLTTTLC